MVDRKANSNRFNLQYSNLNGPILFLEVQVLGANFVNDLVADPSDPADVAAAIGSDLERITELVMDYGSVLGLAVLGTQLVGYIMAYDSGFSEVATAQSLYDRCVDELGFTGYVYVSESGAADNFAIPN